MSNLAIDAALKASNFLNLINIHSSGIFNKIILNSDLNGSIVTGSLNVWNHIISNLAIINQNNTGNAYQFYFYSNNRWTDGYIDKLNTSSYVYGIRVSIKYRE